MVDSMGICEKHELPLDRNGECELCRLSLMPSESPPTKSSWWALVIPLLILGAGLLWALSSFGPAPEATPQRGVPTPAPRPASAVPAPPLPTEPEPRAAPIEPVQAPVEEAIPAEDIPLPDSAKRPAP